MESVPSAITGCTGGIDPAPPLYWCIRPCPPTHALFFTVVSVVIAMVADMTGQGGMLHRVELTDKSSMGSHRQPQQEQREGAQACNKERWREERSIPQGYRARRSWRNWMLR